MNHREATEKSIIQYLNIEYACLGGGDCNCNEDVLYVTLDTWIKDSESGCPDAHRRLVNLDGGGGAKKAVVMGAILEIKWDIVRYGG